MKVYKEWLGIRGPLKLTKKIELSLDGLTDIDDVMESIR